MTMLAWRKQSTYNLHIEEVLYGEQKELWGETLIKNQTLLCSNGAIGESQHKQCVWHIQWCYFRSQTVDLYITLFTNSKTEVLDFLQTNQKAGMTDSTI